MSQQFSIRPCRPDETAVILEIVNAGAEAYRGVIPADRWHDPYMGAEELAREMAAGVQFSACEAEGEVAGVMGIQPVRNVDLIRHAYVRPTWQGRGIGTRLLDRLRETAERPILIGTWAAATWAIRFYERNGFTLVPEAAKARLLKTYWTIPDRQVDTSVVLASPPLNLAGAEALMNASQAGAVQPPSPDRDRPWTPTYKRQSNSS
jgi:GNAT superfamily N-acetyltransferase